MMTKYFYRMCLSVQTTSYVLFFQPYNNPVKQMSIFPRVPHSCLLTYRAKQVRPPSSISAAKHKKECPQNAPMFSIPDL